MEAHSPAGVHRSTRSERPTCGYDLQAAFQGLKWYSTTDSSRIGNTVRPKHRSVAHHTAADMLDVPTVHGSLTHLHGRQVCVPVWRLAPVHQFSKEHAPAPHVALEVVDVVAHHLCQGHSVTAIQRKGIRAEKVMQVGSPHCGPQLGTLSGDAGGKVEN